MYWKILAALNEHLNSEAAARYALTLARSCGARLYLCFIAEKDMPKGSLQKAEDAVKRLFEEARGAGIEAEGITGTGEPVGEIGKIVRHEGIDIVFSATRRQDIERRFYAGTVARRLSLKLPCSAALVRVVSMGRVQPSRILLPLKARIGHIKELAYFVSRMAEGCGCPKVFFFHSTSPVRKFFQGEIHLPQEEWAKRMPPDIADFSERLRKSGIELEGRLSPGEAARGITLEAATKRHDLIIMGASERSLLASILKGNPVEDVLRETPCNLIILKPKHED